MSCEDCLSRRKFLANAAGVAGLVVLTGCGDGIVSGIPPKVTGGGPGGGPGGGGGSGPISIKVGDFPALASNGVIAVVGGGGTVAAVRTGTDTFEAFSMFCTHQGCLTEVVNNAKFVCPCHGSEFSNRGAVTHDPATRPLDKFTTSYDPASDQLTIS
jgi:cytochrome b6-f complex iron-sulfur subunit